MGCGSSAAVGIVSASQKSIVKDAESQTTVSVRVNLTLNSRNEAHELRKEMAFTHYQKALARAQEISNMKSGYTTATYTGSNISTPIHMKNGRLTRNHGSDSDLNSRSYKSESNLSTSSNTQRKRTHVSFRNDEYDRLVEAARRKRKTYFTRSKSPGYHVMKEVTRTQSDVSASSDTTSVNKLADTGYEGSDESQPSAPSLIQTSNKKIRESNLDYDAGTSNPNVDHASNAEGTAETNENAIKSVLLSVKPSGNGEEKHDITEVDNNASKASDDDNMEMENNSPGVDNVLAISEKADINNNNQLQLNSDFANEDYTAKGELTAVA